MDTIDYRAAQEADLPALRALLIACHLPPDGIEHAIPGAVVAYSNGVLIGSAAIEATGPIGLLRSLAVAPTYRGRKVGDTLCTATIAKAQTLGVQEIFLLTTTAGAFFSKRRFMPIQRQAAPAVVQAHVQFLSACPASAQCFRLELGAHANA